MNDKWLDFAIKIQAIAQAGLEYYSINLNIKVI